MKKRLFGLVLVVVLAVSLACTGSAAWSRQIAMQVPGMNASVNTRDDAGSPIYVTKQTTDSLCSFHSYSNTATGAWGIDARLINSEYVARSDWARNLHTGTTVHATTSAVKNYNYYAELSSDVLEFTTVHISFAFSADNDTM